MIDDASNNIVKKSSVQNKEIEMWDYIPYETTKEDNVVNTSLFNIEMESTFNSLENSKHFSPAIFLQNISVISGSSSLL